MCLSLVNLLSSEEILEIELLEIHYIGANLAGLQQHQKRKNPVFIIESVSFFFFFFFRYVSPWAVYLINCICHHKDDDGVLMSVFSILPAISPDEDPRLIKTCLFLIIKCCCTFAVSLQTVIFLRNSSYKDS